MGDYVIRIEGHGIHHNGLDNDANAVGARAVNDLRARGHEVTSATFTLLGGTDDLLAVSENGPPEGQEKMWPSAFNREVVRASVVSEENGG